MCTKSGLIGPGAAVARAPLAGVILKFTVESLGLGGAPYATAPTTRAPAVARARTVDRVLMRIATPPWRSGPRHHRIRGPQPRFVLCVAYHVRGGGSRRSCSCDIARAVSRAGRTGAWMSAVYGQPSLPDGAQRKLIPSSEIHCCAFAEVVGDSTTTAPWGTTFTRPSAPLVIVAKTSR